MKFWYKFLFIPILIFALAGCGKDDDDIVVNNDDNETPYVPYHSLDMTTEDGKVTQLLKHKVGKGIPIVILGDGFVDMDIKVGNFRDATTSTIDAIFSVHPFKSLRDYFDVYEVTAVSYNYTNLMDMTADSINYKTAFSTYGLKEIGSNAYTSEINKGDQTKMLKYAKKAIGEDRIDDATIIMLINDWSSGGVTYYSTYIFTYGYIMDVPTGCGISYVPLEDIMKFNDDTPLKDIVTSNYDDISKTTFASTLLHEFGHGFAKLADEYINEEREWNDIESDKNNLILYQKSGYHRNVSLESDVTKTYWADFAADSRYDFEKLGCYEGGEYQATGVYRPTENSIMRCTTNYFNVISRVMIYKRCMNIAYGDSWKFDYEDFVKFDLEKAKAAYQEDKERHPYGYSKSKRFGAPPRFVKMKASR
jgi:hypothetical protein